MRDPQMSDKGVDSPLPFDFKKSLLALGLGVVVHICVWFGARLLYGLAPSLAFEEALGQGLIASCWLIMVLSYWQIWPPLSRWQGLVHVFVSAFIVGGLGSLLGLFRHAAEDQGIGGVNLPVFFIYALGLVLAQSLLAVPAGVSTTLFVMSGPAKQPIETDQDLGDQS
jgi:hypothetical protein